MLGKEGPAVGAQSRSEKKQSHGFTSGQLAFGAIAGAMGLMAIKTLRKRAQNLGAGYEELQADIEVPTESTSLLHSFKPTTVAQPSTPGLRRV